jgi:ribosomal protein L37E
LLLRWRNGGKDEQFILFPKVVNIYYFRNPNYTIGGRMSEQYRCNNCGYVFDMSEMMCSECGNGRLKLLRWTKGGDGSHWEGCAEAHWDCKIAQLEQELNRRDEQISTLVETVARLKEDGERLFNHPMFDQDYWTMCPYCDSTRYGIGNPFHHKDSCPITLHRTLMKELE